ncbi:tRNA-uridine aminocarboxypropyltransferase 2-like [Oscarella lobularis]|uniref:tRNA-uridine aminocarboxypropyltransferase 2-like n=1 Tax=Oscarella lobularis TaxID=121494 RepID=UPI0033134864
MALREDDSLSSGPFSGLIDLPFDPSKKRAKCDRCQRPASVCLCNCLPRTPVLIATEVHILQHPNEERRSLTTVPILTAALARDKIHIYRSKVFSRGRFPTLDDALDAHETVLLYPGREAVDVSDVSPSGRLPRVKNLLLLDGTWRQAREIYKKNPRLHVLKQVELRMSVISAYVIRTQPTDQCLSTAESAALALSVIEGRADLYDVIIRPLTALCHIQIGHGAGAHESRERKRQKPHNVVS